MRNGRIENLYFVFAIFKMHSQSQQPKRNYYNVETKIERDLQTHGRVVSLKWLFLVKNGDLFTFGYCEVCKTLQNFH